MPLSWAWFSIGIADGEPEGKILPRYQLRVVRGVKSPFPRGFLLGGYFAAFKWAVGPFFNGVVCMNTGTRQSNLQEMLEPAVTAMDCELWGIEFSSGRGSTLRIFIEKDGGVELEDCERVSRQISSILDVEDPISSEYVLEVSSPGMDRPLFTLEQFDRFAGQTINVKLKVPYEGRRKYKGLLVGIENQDVVLRCEGHEFLFPSNQLTRRTLFPISGRIYKRRIND